MSYNPIIKGFRAFKVLVTRGYAQNRGYVSRICRTWTDHAQGLCLRTVPFICIRTFTDDFICLNIYDTKFVSMKTSSKDFIKMKVSSI